MVERPKSVWPMALFVWLADGQLVVFHCPYSLQSSSRKQVVPPIRSWRGMTIIKERRQLSYQPQNPDELSGDDNSESTETKDPSEGIIIYILSSTVNLATCWPKVLESSPPIKHLETVQVVSKEPHYNLSPKDKSEQLSALENINIGRPCQTITLCKVLLFQSHTDTLHNISVI